jgi:small basic protein
LLQILKKKIFFKKKKNIFYNFSLSAFSSLYVSSVGVKLPTPTITRKSFGFKFPDSGIFALNSIHAVYKILMVTRLIKRNLKYKFLLTKVLILSMSNYLIKKIRIDPFFTNRGLFKLKKIPRVLNPYLKKGIIAHSAPSRSGLRLNALNKLLKKGVTSNFFFLKLILALTAYFKKNLKNGQLSSPRHIFKNIIFYNFKSLRPKIYYKKIVSGVLLKKKLLNFKSFYYLVYSLFQRHNIFYN